MALIFGILILVFPHLLSTLVGLFFVLLGINLVAFGRR